MSDRRKITGECGEIEAAQYLKRKGFKILERNAEYCGVETDIIAVDKDTTVFVEVKTRSNTTFGAPVEAVTRAKQRRYFNAAKAYAVQHKIPLENLRFDVIEVLDGEINHIENAFGE